MPLVLGLLLLLGAASDPLLRLLPAPAEASRRELDDADAPGRPVGQPILWHLRERLSTARAELRAGTRAIPCAPFDGLRFPCGGADYVYAGLYAGPVKGRELACVWMHPAGRGDLTLIVDDLPPTERVQGFAALLDGAGARGAVDVRVLLGGRPAVRTRLRADDGPHTLDARLGEPTSGRLELLVHATAPAWRLLCLDLYGVGPASDGGS